MKKRTQNSVAIKAKGKPRGNPDKTIPYRWKPGQSGNPGGRPKKDVAAEIAQMIFEKNYEGIYKAMCKGLLKGNPKVFVALADRGYGKPQQTIKVEDERTDSPERIADILARAAQRAKQVPDRGRAGGSTPDPD